jgi:hypothetical protein
VAGIREHPAGIKRLKILYMSHTKRSIDPTYKDRFDTTRDGKKWYKPPKAFKKIKRRQEKAKAKQALRAGKEPERTPKKDVYEYL